ncbi:MAG: UvrD-helicase domain-containing protein [Luteimonas sp.]
MSAAPRGDAILDTPLRARSLIEASAGTGKTYALAGLFARAVIVERLRVAQILAVTYTVAATQELHERVRLRLQQAAMLARHWRAGEPAAADGDSAEAALLRRLIHSALADGRESPTALRMRLQRAARELDLAAITTIHGFCQRVLAEHALEAGQPLLAAGLVPGNAAQRSALAVALWRGRSDDAEEADFLQRWFGDIDGLANALRDLLAPEPLLPAAPSDDACAARDGAWIALQAEFAASGARLREEFGAAIRKRVLSGARDKRIPVDALCDWLAAQSERPLRAHPQLMLLTPAAVEAAYLPSSRAPVPRHPLCPLVEAYLRAEEACDVQRLHALRRDARARDAADKQAFNYRDYDDLVAAVHAATQDPDVAPTLAASLRAQYPLVLVDEFQDTDARQWAIFERLFGDGEGGLLLVGDPKQAIYRFRGGDVETYLLARDGAQRAAPLLRNFRARPCVLSAVNLLFAQAPEGALGPRIGFVASEPGRDADCDTHLQRDGRAMPPLTFRAVPPRMVAHRNGRIEHKDWDRPESTRHAARLCAEAIAGLLRDARAGQASRMDGGTSRPLLPRDMAVLVREHREAAAVRHALGTCGVPAVSAGRGSLFDTPQARTLLALLLALASPGDERRLRAALATPLFGFDAPSLCALEDDGDALRRWQDDVMRWRLRWEQHGPQAMLAEVVAMQAPRLLGMADGERELTCLLQLAELLQEARASAFDTRGLGPRGQIDWLQDAIAHADGGDETQWPRLESDAGRVQILTLHASKGLEFPLVFLPFAGIGRRDGVRGNVVDYHAANGIRVRQRKTRWVHGDEPPWEDACTRAKAEDAAEDMRLLYVGLTRARDALWLCGGALANNGNAALHRLLGAGVPPPELQLSLGGLLDLQAGLPPPRSTRLPQQTPPAVPAARVPQRTLRRDWWIHSFSQLHRQRPHGAQALVDEAPADDERPLAVVGTLPPRFGGTRFGNALHHALEHVDFARWRDRDGNTPPEDQAGPLQAAMQAQDYGGDEVEDGARALSDLVARTLNAALPVGPGNTVTRLCDIAVHDRVAELEFHFTLHDTDTRRLLELLHAHGVAAARRDFGAWPRMSGLMNGRIDLTCRVDGRVYVLDYKSNRLPDYDDATLRQAMAASEYDLQALLYVVAAHRWLRLRRGTAYDYERDVGGALYLFCRGLQPGDTRGIVTLAFPRALVEGVDALCGGGVAS